MPRVKASNSRFTVLITDHRFANVEQERQIVESAGGKLEVAQCKTADEVIAKAGDADALLVQWAPITAQVISKLKNCKIIVRYGVGVDNIDLVACRERGIAVCNVPDYCVDEVADHSMAMALALVRQLPFIERRLRSGTWKITPVSPMPSCNEMTFATCGYGRIARAVLYRARSFKFQVAAYDPYILPDEFERDGIRRLTLDEMFADADVLSLHSPLTEETRHLVNATRLTQMKPTAILVNTARGELVDTVALAEALRKRTIAYAGIDVYEIEPVPADHPLFGCDNALLTSHNAWYSERSLPQLQRLAAGEVVRGLRGEPLKNQVNV